jgi:hypothetical protein
LPGLEREAHCLALFITEALQEGKQDNEGRWSGEAATAHPFPRGDGRGDQEFPLEGVGGDLVKRQTEKGNQSFDFPFQFGIPYFDLCFNSGTLISNLESWFQN